MGTAQTMCGRFMDSHITRLHHPQLHPTDGCGRSGVGCGHGCAHHKLGWRDGIRVDPVNGHATVAVCAYYGVWARPEQPCPREEPRKHRLVDLSPNVISAPCVDQAIECFVPVLEDLVEWLVDSGCVRRGEVHNPFSAA